MKAKMFYSALAVAAFLALAAAYPLGVDSGRINKGSCTFKGKKLYGKVQVVDNWPDFKVQVVDNWPDLKVQRVNNWPDKCGKWQFVKNWPDFKIKFVRNWPDFKIKYVRNWPGVP